MPPAKPQARSFVTLILVDFAHAATLVTADGVVFELIPAKVITRCVSGSDEALPAVPAAAKASISAATAVRNPTRFIAAS
jgi:hypothetical protein